MGPLAQEMDRIYTYKDYLGWDDGERWELIHGHPYNMTPAPSRIHQDISGELFRQIANYLADKPCKVYAAPFDVRLPTADERDDDIRTVVQPDITVVCDRSKLDDRGCKGSPDMIVEITSPATARKDMKEKFLLYEETGVREYWVVNPDVKTVMIFKLGEDKRFGRPEVYSEEDTILVTRFEGLAVELKPVFQE